MMIYVVKPGDTIDSIGQMYGVAPEEIIRSNELTNPDQLVVGQTIVIIYPGSSDQRKAEMTINGYTYPYIDREVLSKTLPYLTYLTLFGYGVTPQGELITIEDEEVIEIARGYGVAPIMLISTFTEDGTFSNELASTIVNDKEVQEALIENILEKLKAKNYYGLDIDFEYVFPRDRELYVEFVNNVTTRLNGEGYPVITALAPKVSADQIGLLYEGHDYYGIGEAANLVLLMTYEWGYTYGPPMAVAPINKVKEVLDYAMTEINPKKILMGMPNYGYDWTLPYVKGKSKAKSLSNVDAVELAAQTGSMIAYDPLAQAPFFDYDDENGNLHQVWFEDARSVEAKAKLAENYGFHGLSYWNIMKYFPQNWLVVDALYDIKKVL